jgi:hypothetical protein
VKGIAEYFKDFPEPRTISTEGGYSGKKKDSYPLNLSTIQQAFEIAEEGNMDKCVYVL